MRNFTFAVLAALTLAGCRDDDKDKKTSECVSDTADTSTADTSVTPVGCTDSTGDHRGPAPMAVTPALAITGPPPRPRWRALILVTLRSRLILAIPRLPLILGLTRGRPTLAVLTPRQVKNQNEGL